MEPTPHRPTSRTNYQVTVSPRCPKCQSGDTIATHSHRVRSGVQFDGCLCHATRQDRRCKACGEAFQVMKIGARMRSA